MQQICALHAHFLMFIPSKILQVQKDLPEMHSGLKAEFQEFGSFVKKARYELSPRSCISSPELISIIYIWQFYYTPRRGPSMYLKEPDTDA